MDHLDVGGLHIAYREAGSGPPLLLLHGAPGDSRLWLDQVAELSDGCRVVAWDQPGCGESADAPGAMPTEWYADQAAALAGALGLGPAHVLGHSWGSTVALSLHQRHPDAVRSLVLAGPYAGWAGSLPADEVERRRRLAAELADREPGSWDPATIPGLFSDRIDEAHTALLEQVLRDARPAAMRTVAEALAATDLRSHLPSVDVPTLLLAGRLDERSPVSVGEAMRALLPDATLVVLQEAGHEMFFEDPAGCHDAVRRFLADR